MRYNPAGNQISEEAREGGTPGARAETALQTMVNITVKPVAPPQTMKDHAGAGCQQECVRDSTLEQTVPKGLPAMRRTHNGAGEQHEEE